MECSCCGKIAGSTDKLFEPWVYVFWDSRDDLTDVLCGPCGTRLSEDLEQLLGRPIVASDYVSPRERMVEPGVPPGAPWFNLEMIPNERVLDEAKDRLFVDLAPTKADFWRLYRERLVDPEESHHASRMKQRIIEASESPISNAHRQVH